MKDKRCFLLGGGPSLQGFDYKRLVNEFTIGINKTFTVFSPTIVYCMDLPFYKFISKPGNKRKQRELHNKWSAYDGYKVILCPRRRHVFEKDVYVVDRIDKKVISLDVGKGIFPGRNSGFGALTLAMSMGCKDIALLGYDLSVHEERTHFHDGYPKSNQDLKDFVLRLEKFKKEFEEFADTIKEEKITVVNLSEVSALECFPKDSIVNYLSKNRKV